MTIQDKLRAELRRKRVAAVAPLQAAPGRRQHGHGFWQHRAASTEYRRADAHCKRWKSSGSGTEFS